MPGPLPKPDELRRRRNLEGKSIRLERRTGEPPALSPRADDKPWDEAICSWWAEAWRSPMASRWHGAEVHVLVRYCELWQWWRDELADGKPDPSVLPAMAAIEERFGLSVTARRRLNWEIEPDDDVPAPTLARQRPKKRTAARTDPRLEVISGGKERSAPRQEVGRPRSPAAKPRR